LSYKFARSLSKNMNPYERHFREKFKNKFHLIVKSFLFLLFKIGAVKILSLECGCGKQKCKIKSRFDSIYIRYIFSDVLLIVCFEKQFSEEKKLTPTEISKP
jgi:hypothetical protein